LKTRRIASSLALAAVLAVGATGCGLAAPQGTTQDYAPSDGIDVNVGTLKVRNLLLIADETGENFNVVFTGVNDGEAPGLLRVVFVSEEASSEASADFLLEPGLTMFGDPNGATAPTLVTIPNLKPGATIDAYFEVAGGGEVQRQVPVLDGTLAEYRDLVLSPSQMIIEDDVELEAAPSAEAGAEATAEAEAEASN
jgi:hypothetical protein